jgi:sortase A
MRGLASRLRRGTGSVRPEETIDRAQGAGLAAFYDRRAAAALAYCSKVCAPEAIADAVEASFARVFEAAAAGGPTDDDSLDASLRSAVRTESAGRSSAATAGISARRLLDRFADPSRGGACELMPALLAARADGLLSEGDRERMSAHLRRCDECRTAEHRFNEAERAFDALAGDDAPALGRSLLAEMLADAPLSDRRRFARERLAEEPPEWLEEIDWQEEPKVVQVPEDALDEVEPPQPEPAPISLPRPASEITQVATEDFPMVERRRRLRLGDGARKRIAIAMLVVAALLLGEAGVTLAWKEPFTAFMAARSQDDLTKQLHKLDGQPLTAAEKRRVASIDGVDARTKARMAALAAHERTSVADGDALGTITIGKIDVDDVVVQGTDAPDLRKGPGRYTKTFLPGEGKAVGVAGHRTSYGAPFRNVDDLKTGDTIAMKMPYGTFTYAVDRHRIVPADFNEAFADVKGEVLVLSACHPLYSASERILVYAHLVSARPSGAAVETGPTPPGVDTRALARERTAKRLKLMGDRNLAPGMTGDDVKEVQRLLGLPASGTFGPETTAAVTEFQRSHGLPAIGRVGSQTKAALARRPHPPSRPPTPPAVPQQQQPGSTSGTQTTPTAPYQPGTSTPGTGSPSG